MKKLLTLLEDNSGGLSSSRFQMLLWTVGVLVVWIYMAIYSMTTPISVETYQDKNNPAIVYVEKTVPKLPAIPETVLVLLLGVSSVKVIQRFGEKSDSSSTDDSTAPTVTPKQ